MNIARLRVLSLSLFSTVSFTLYAQQNIGFSPLKKSPIYSPNTRLLEFDKFQNLLFVNDDGTIPVIGSHKNKGGVIALFNSWNVRSKVRSHTFTAELSPEQIKDLSHQSEITFVDISTKLNSARKNDQKALAKSKVDQVYEIKSPPIKGSDVVVGIVDIGFQTTHPTFFNENGGQYRVKRFWQQKYKNLQGPLPFEYGILKNSEDEILKATDNDGAHGTHVAGIASGSGFKSPDLRYAGVAPESDLVFVGIKYQNDTIGGSALGDYIVANNAIIDGFDYVFDYADSMQKPAVCNLSWGMHTGPHDGTSLFDLSLEDLVNTKNKYSGNNNGRILVGANGNSAQHEMHVHFDLNNDTLETLAMDRSRDNYKKEESVYCDFWAEKGSSLDMKISLIDSNGIELLTSGYFSFHQDDLIDKVFTSSTDTLKFTTSHNKTYPHNGKSNVLLMAYTPTNKRFFKVSFAGSGEIHGWNSGRVREWTSGTFRNYIRKYKPANWVNGDADHTLIENGGTSKAIISVGAYNNRVNWLNFKGNFQSDSAVAEGEISRFSSHGPSIDGRIKPDVSAPGQFIASAYHKDAVPGWLSPYVVHLDSWNDDPVYYVLLSGTSMASPQVAGVVALMLDASNGTLNYQQLSEILRETAYRDEFSGEAANDIYGFGKVNAYQAVIQSIQTARRNNIQENSIIAYVNKNRDIAIKSNNVRNSEKNRSYILYSTDGRVVQEGSVINNVIHTGHDIKTGIYLLHLTDDQMVIKQSLFIP
jgi:minor extracellular serine protease Vpr